MTLKEVITQTSRKLGLDKIFKPAEPIPQIDNEGLISQEKDETRQPSEEGRATIHPSSIVHPALSLGTTPSESLEKLQIGFERLVEQLAGINEKLGNQAAAHEELMSRIRQLPKILESFPASTENQKQLTENLIEHLKGAEVRSEKFIDSVEKIPAETLKQTDALAGIEHQLAAAADIDVQMSESFNNFNRALDKLNEKTASQTESIDQMARTFAAGDRYLKYIISQQTKRFMWIFIASIVVCAVVILILTGIIIFLK
jgi:hypothetical protein